MKQIFPEKVLHEEALTALKASSRVLQAAGGVVLLAGFLGGLFDEGFLLWGSAAGGTCSLLCFFPVFSKLPYKVSAILIGAEKHSSRRKRRRSFKAVA